MFHRILIANRGEIALRVIRACRELGVETVAVYSTADRDTLPVQLATRAVCIGPARSAESYLNQAAVLTAAVESGCEAVHPGYGFLSENADFADLCQKCGLSFIGPSGDVIRAMGDKAAARRCGYQGAGTVEFVLDREGRFYFIEMNTRIQVEHPVTEMVTGVDLVKEQIRVAAGLPLSFTQEEAVVRGHAIEVRVNAEDPANGFRPCPGKTEFVHFPGGCGVRVDSALYTGAALSPYYDSMVAKLIVHAPTRLGAIRRMRRCLEELTIQGYPTTADLAYLILYHGDYLRGRYDTGFLEEHLEELLSWQPGSREGAES